MCFAENPLAVPRNLKRACHHFGRIAAQGLETAKWSVGTIVGAIKCHVFLQKLAFLAKKSAEQIAKWPPTDHLAGLN